MTLSNIRDPSRTMLDDPPSSRSFLVRSGNPPLTHVLGAVPAKVKKSRSTTPLKPSRGCSGSMATSQLHRKPSSTCCAEPAVGPPLLEVLEMRRVDQKDADDEVNPPDHGLRAWLVVAGAAHVSFAAGGFVNTWGVFQSYYQDTLFAGESASKIAWIGSIQYCLYFMPGLVMGRLVDIGAYRIPFFAAGLLFPVGVIVTAQCSQFWQTLLSQAFLAGGSGGVLFGTAMALTGHWFIKRRALAFGIVSASSSIGGTIFPIMVRKVLTHLGFPWAMRICGFILAYASVFALLTIKPRKAPVKVPGGMLNLRAFKSCAYSCCVVGSFFVMLGLYTPLSYFDVTGTQLNLGEYSTYLISIANAASLFGRLVPGLVGDRFGPFNLLIPGLLGSAATTLAWPFANTLATITVVATLNGAFQGIFVSLYAPGIAQMGTADDLGRRIGMLSSVIGLGSLFGPPISGAILNATASLHPVSYFAAAVVLGGAVIMTGCRWCMINGFWGKV